MWRHMILSAHYTLYTGFQLQQCIPLILCAGMYVRSVTVVHRNIIYTEMFIITCEVASQLLFQAEGHGHAVGGVVVDFSMYIELSFAL